jgi:2-C-methyl-D-erythritol 2,4-cyclodiphosphate synthase
VLAAPKIGPISGDMRQRVAELLDILPTAVGIKAKTPEGMGLNHVAQAHAVVLLEAIDDTDGISLLEAEIDDPKTVEKVVSELVGEGRGGGKSRRMVPLPEFDTEDIT